MAIDSYVLKLKNLLNQFFELEPEKFLSSESENPVGTSGDEPDISEVISLIQYLRSTYAPLIQGTQIKNLTINTTIGLISQLNEVLRTYDQLRKAPSGGSYEAFALSLDLFVSKTQTCGILSATSDHATHLESIKTALQLELERTRRNNTEIDELKKQTQRALVEGISGSLSSEFTNRKKMLCKFRVALLIICFSLLMVLIFKTSSLITELLSVTKDGVEFKWAALLLRTFALAPILIALAFSFSQYRKERYYEEEYAYKAAVAHSLPDYGNLTTNAVVRDQIVTASTKIIFSSPNQQPRKTERDHEAFDMMKEVVGVLTKTLDRK